MSITSQKNWEKIMSLMNIPLSKQNKTKKPRTKMITCMFIGPSPPLPCACPSVR